MTGNTAAIVGVLALQGGFSEHLQHLKKAAEEIETPRELSFTLVRTPAELEECSALVIPGKFSPAFLDRGEEEEEEEEEEEGGESTAMALVAERGNILEPLREFVKVHRRPTWGTCAGMILLSEAANRTKTGGQSLIGGLSVRVNRNHFGRQTESFGAALRLSFLGEGEPPFRGIFIRAPIVESVLPKEAKPDEVEVHAPSRKPKGDVEKSFSNDENVEIICELSVADTPLHEINSRRQVGGVHADAERGYGERADTSTIVAVRQGNVVGTSFHPELTEDTRMHKWWLGEVLKDLTKREELLRAQSGKP